MIRIIPRKVRDSEVTVPGSKSYTHRILIAAALSDGMCTIGNALRSDDTHYTINALKQMSISITEEDDLITVQGTNGSLKSPVDPIYLGNSGTSMRLLTAVAALGQGACTLTGTRRMAERPIQDLLDGLGQLGVSVQCVNGDNCPPVEVVGGGIEGGPVSLNCGTSSQFLSALLLIAPLTKKGIDITVTKGPVSKPYIDMTISVMERLGVEVHREEYETFHIPGRQTYRPGFYQVEPDGSQAGYFWAAAAVTGASIRVKGLGMDSRQGDVRFAEVLEKMGCALSPGTDGITLTGGALSAIEVDMADMPDLVPTLAVVAAHAKGTTIIKNVAHLKVKESDRLMAVTNELRKMGIDVRCTDDGLIIHGGTPLGAAIDTYDDHRIAMSFAVAGLVTPGVFIKDERCVEKSFPNFWDVFEGLKGD